MTDASTFNDWEEGDGPDDSAAVDDYMAEVAAAVEAFGLVPMEPGEPEPES